jgi:hypothetical protein
MIGSADILECGTRILRVIHGRDTRATSQTYTTTSYPSALAAST